MQKSFEDLFPGQKNKKNEINAPELKIKENVIYYVNRYQVKEKLVQRETALQINNISQIDVGPAPKTPYPSWAIWLIVMGLFVFSLGKYLSGFIVLGLILIMIGSSVLYLIYHSNQNAGDNLTIFLNSGSFFIFNFSNAKFLSEVFQTLINCMNGNVSGETVINIEKSTITHSVIGTDNVTVSTS